MLLSVLKVFFSMILSKISYPFVVGWLVKYGVYDKIYDIFSPPMQEYAIGLTMDSSMEMIQNLSIPDMMKNFLLEHNTMELYEKLGVITIVDYVVGFFSFIILNIIVAFAMFIVFQIILSILFKTLEILSQLPIIRVFNQWGGLLLGAACGVFFIWICYSLLGVFLTTNTASPQTIQHFNTSLIGHIFENKKLFLEYFINGYLESAGRHIKILDKVLLYRFLYKHGGLA